jgi:uncharacterized protein (DUF1330 family)
VKPEIRSKIGSFFFGPLQSVATYRRPLRSGDAHHMAAFVIFDVEIQDAERYQEFMRQVKPALAAAGGQYLARGGQHKVYEGDWNPRRIVVLQFPSIAAWEAFYFGSSYQNLKAIRDECSAARLVCVEGL